MSNRPGSKIYIGELVENSGEKVVKIGMTIGDPMVRLTRYAAQHGYSFSRETAKVVVFNVTPSVMRGVEFVLHNMFKAARIGTQEVFRIPFHTAVKAAEKIIAKKGDNSPSRKTASGRQCGAMTRSGRACRTRVGTDGRCRWHG